MGSWAVAVGLGCGGDGQESGGRDADVAGDTADAAADSGEAADASDDPMSWPSPTAPDGEWLVARVEAGGAVAISDCPSPEASQSGGCSAYAPELAQYELSAAEAPAAPFTVAVRRLPSGAGLVVPPGATDTSFRMFFTVGDPARSKSAAFDPFPVALELAVRPGPQVTAPEVYHLASDEPVPGSRFPSHQRWEAVPHQRDDSGRYVLEVTTPGVYALAGSDAGVLTETGPLAIPTSSGNHELGFAHQGRLRRLLVMVPEGYDGATRLPLVMVLHGSGQDAGVAASQWSWGQLAETRGFVLAVGEGTWGHEDPLADSFMWSGRVDPGPPDPGYPENLAYVRRVIESLQASLQIDAKRVYVTGFSGGGVLTHRVGTELNDLVAAIAPVAALGIGDTEDAPHPVPDDGDRLSVLMVMGTEDGSHPYEGAPPKPGAVQSIEEWAGRYGCDETPTTETNGALKRDVYACSDAPPDAMALITVRGAGHTYTMVDPHGLTTAQAVWEFLSQHAKP